MLHFTVFITDSLRESPLDVFISSVEALTADGLIAAARAAYVADLPPTDETGDPWVDNGAVLVGAMPGAPLVMSWDPAGVEQELRDGGFAMMGRAR